MVLTSTTAQQDLKMNGHVQLTVLPVTSEQEGGVVQYKMEVVSCMNTEIVLSDILMVIDF